MRDEVPCNSTYSANRGPFWSTVQCTSLAYSRYLRLRLTVFNRQQFLHWFCTTWDRWLQRSVPVSWEECCRLTYSETTRKGGPNARSDKWTCHRACHVTYSAGHVTTGTWLDAVTWHANAVHLDNGCQQSEEWRTHVHNALTHDQHVHCLNIHTGY